MANIVETIPIKIKSDSGIITIGALSQLIGKGSVYVDSLSEEDGHWYIKVLESEILNFNTFVNFVPKSARATTPYKIILKNNNAFYLYWNTSETELYVSHYFAEYDEAFNTTTIYDGTPNFYHSYLMIYNIPNVTSVTTDSNTTFMIFDEDGERYTSLGGLASTPVTSEYPHTTAYDFFYGSYKEPFGDNSEEGGGNGEYDDTTGSVDFPSLPNVSALSTGLIQMYNPTIDELKQIGNFLWTTDFAVNIAKLFADPMESLISLNLFPVTPIISENKIPVRFGNINAITGGENPAQIVANPLTSQFVQFDCGKINLSEYWASALDYSPYTKAELYLPFISTQSIDIDDIMNAELHLTYNIDMLTGGCTALLKVTKNIDGTPLNSVLYSWGGNMSTQIPLFATDYTQKIQSLINATIGVGVTALSGGSGMAIASGVVGGAMNIAGAKPHIQKGSSLSMATGSLANFTPYIILTRPIQSKPENYQHYVGWTSNITKTIGELSGFTQMEYVHIENMGTATSDEKNEIEQLLKDGVII